jgi:serine/threonine protein kinase
MSPEQAEGSKTVDARSDIWALGVIAYECLLGRRPFDEEALGALLLAICVRPLPVPSRVGPVPTGFDAWFARACERYLDLRFQSAKEAAAELRRVCGASSALGADVEMTGNFSAPTAGPVLEVQPHALANSASGLSATRMIGPSVSSKRASWAAVAVVVCGLLAAIVITLTWKQKPANPSASASAALDSVALAPSTTAVTSAPRAPLEPSAPPALAAASPTTAEPAKPIVAAAPQSPNPKSKSASSPKHPAAPSKPPASEHTNAPPQPKPGINLGL